MSVRPMIQMNLIQKGDLLLILFLVFLIPQKGTCQIPDTINQLYGLKNSEGIYVEHFDPSNRNENRFTENNEVYKAGRVFTFDYSFYDKNKNQFFFRSSDNTGSPLAGWEFVPAEKKTSNTITGIKMIIKTGLQGFERISKDYSQTIIQYKYLHDSGEAHFSEQTGVIENKKNVWMHPPRTMLFEILEINPFPFVLKDTTKVWEWKLTVGSMWGDSRWVKWVGSTENNMKYVAVGLVNLKTPLGKIKCRKVIAEGKTRVGTTKLISYFNETYGFVKLIYTNIDGSLLTINLKDMKE